MPSLSEILNDPNYVNANTATKKAIFDKYSADDSNYTEANQATQAAIRQKFGISTSAPVIAPEPEHAGVIRRAGDLGVSLAQGVAGLPEVVTGLADIPTMGYAGKGIEEAEKAIFGGTTKDLREKLQEYKSEDQKAAEQKVAEAQGFGGTLKEYIKNPSAIADVVAQSAPSMIGGAGIGRGLLAAGEKGLMGATGKKIAPSIAAAIGEGTVTAGQITEQVRQDSENGLITPGQAGLTTLAGILTGGLSVFGSKIANKLGTENIETILVGGKKLEYDPKALQHPLLAAVKGALNESVFEELPQSMQEQILQNLAEGKPWDEGVAQQAAAGMLAGMAMGGPFSAVHQMGVNANIAEQERKKAEATKTKTEVENVSGAATETKAAEEAPVDTAKEIDNILNTEKDIKLLAPPKTTAEDENGQPITTESNIEQGAGVSNGVPGESANGAPAITSTANGPGLVEHTGDVGITQTGKETKPSTLEKEKQQQPSVETTPLVEEQGKLPPDRQKRTRLLTLKEFNNQLANKALEEQSNKVNELMVREKLTKEQAEKQVKERFGSSIQQLTQSEYDALHPYLKTEMGLARYAPLNKEQGIEALASEETNLKRDTRDVEGFEKELTRIAKEKTEAAKKDRLAEVNKLISQGVGERTAQNRVGNVGNTYYIKDGKRQVLNYSKERPYELFEHDPETGKSAEQQYIELQEKYEGKRAPTTVQQKEAKLRQEFKETLTPEEQAAVDAKIAKNLENEILLNRRSIEEERQGKQESAEYTLDDVTLTHAPFIKEHGLSAVINHIVDKVKALKGDVKVEYGDVPDKRPGMFNPDTNTITIDPKNLNGMVQEQVITHELGHYLLDHIIDNQNVPGALSREQKNALNRLEQIRRQVIDKLGKDAFDIPNLKEFVSELLSNRDFQHAVASLDSKEGYKPKEGLVRKIAKAILDALGLEGLKPVVLQESLDLIESIISDKAYKLPTKTMKGKEVSFAPEVKEPKKAEEKPPFSVEEQAKKLEVVQHNKPSFAKILKDNLWGAKTWKEIEKKVQNQRAPIKYAQQDADRAGLLQVLGDKFNNVYDYIATSFGKADFLFREYLEKPMNETRKLIQGYADAAGIKVSVALGNLHQLAQALHENERRYIKYLMHVPLSIDAIYKLKDGTKISPAGLRERIFDIVNTRELIDVADLKKLRAQLEDLVKNHRDITGESMGGSKYSSLDLNSSEYNVVAGMDSEEVKAVKDYYDPSKYKYRAEMDKVLESLKPIHDATLVLNTKGDYGTNALINSKNFYDFKNYVPLKGSQEKRKKLPRDSAKFDLDDVRLSTELKEAKHTMEGSEHDAENPVLQTLVEGAKSVARAGRKGVTESVRNAVLQGILKGKVKTYTAKQVYDMAKNNKVDEFLRHPNVIFHYNTDGTLDAVRVDEQDQLEAIRRTYKKTNPIVDKLNTFTSTLGQGHTRYSPPFPVLNYIRDALTNSFVIAIEKNPLEAAKFLGHIATQIINGNLIRAGKIARLFHKGEIGKLKEYAKTNEFTKSLVEYMENGGRVSYIQGLSIGSQLDQLWKDASKHKFFTTKESIEKFFDTYTDMFELSARTAAYRVVKQNLLNKGVKEDQAVQQAVAYVKGLANFEEVGENGKALGAMFIFFRPNATGAQRALSAIAPMLRTWDAVRKGLDPQIFGKEGERTADQQARVDTYEKNWRKQSRSATVVCAVLTAMGYATYALAAGLSGRDDEDRNNVESDDLARWTRFARFDIGDGKVIQMPWGFGLGAFAATGAQIAGATMSPSNNMGDALVNIMGIGLDSFLPLPVSRMNPLDKDKPFAFYLDSLTPSAARPFVEFTMNMNGFGQEIYNSRQTKYGDAYTGGDNVPEMYKDAAALLVEITDGGMDISPNSMYFFVNNYLDGWGRMVSNGYDISLQAQGKKDIDLIQNTMLLQSFNNKLSNVDQREYSKIEQDILDKEKIINEFKKSNPEQYIKYIEKHPYDEAMVDAYNKLNGQYLKTYQQQANTIRRDRSLSPKERKEELDMNRLSQNMIKHTIVENVDILKELDSN